MVVAVEDLCPSTQAITDTTLVVDTASEDGLLPKAATVCEVCHALDGAVRIIGLIPLRVCLLIQHKIFEIGPATHLSKILTMGVHDVLEVAKYRQRHDSHSNVDVACNTASPRRALFLHETWQVPASS